MKLKISEKTKQVLKFEAKLLGAVLVLGLMVYFGTMSLIYKSADYVANAYTQDLR